VFCRRLLLLIIALSVASCSRRPESKGIDRIAIVDFENLTGDSQLDWIGNACASVLAAQLNGSKQAEPYEVASVREIPSVSATETVQGYFTVENGALHISTAIDTAPPSAKARRLQTQGSLSAGILPLIDTLAHELAPDAKAFSTRNENAAREYFQAMLTPAASERIAHLELAVKADPNFAPAYLARLQIALGSGDPSAARSILAEAQSHAANFSELDRARLDVVQANADGDTNKRAEALARVAKLLPSDVEVWQTLASLYMARKDYAKAVQAYQAAHALRPEDIPLINSLGYAQAYAGDLNGAVKTFSDYRRLAPQDANALDSLGEIHFLTGRFSDAERYFLEAEKMNTAALGGVEFYRAGLSRYLTGDAKGANDLFQQFAALRAKGSGAALLPVQQAVWKYQTGDTKGAIADLRRVVDAKETSPDPAAAGHGQLAIWLLESGDAAGARQHAASALRLARSPASRNFAGICAFMASPDVSPAEWKQRVERALPGAAQAGARNQLLGYALLLNRHYPEAIEVWRQSYESATLETLSEARVMLASAYALDGQPGEAAKLLQSGILPPRNPDPNLNTMMFARYAELRAVTKKSQ